MATIKAYEVTVEINGQATVITLDDTFPSIEGWASAATMAVLMAKHIHPTKEIEFISCAEYESDEYEDIDGYIYPAEYVVN